MGPFSKIKRKVIAVAKIYISTEEDKVCVSSASLDESSLSEWEKSTFEFKSKEPGIEANVLRNVLLLAGVDVVME